MWPVLMIALIFFIHNMIITYLPVDREVTNKTVSFFVQVIGGLLVLYSIDSNVGIIKKKNLLDVLVNYLREFPPIQKPSTCKLQVPITINIDVAGTGAVERNPNTIDEKIAYLQEQIDDLKAQLHRSAGDISNKMEKQRTELLDQIAGTRTKIACIEENLEQVSIGGVKVQLFGVLLIIYGSLTTYIA